MNEEKEDKKVDSKELNVGQQKVIESNDTFCVIAGAGTGKTKTLVEYIIKFLEDDPKNRSITEVLGLTYTDKAAGEMRRRLLDGLIKKFQETTENNEKNIFWSGEIRKLGNSSIGTIHSFAYSFLKKNAWTIGLPLGLDMEDKSFDDDLRDVMATFIHDRNEHVIKILNYLPYSTNFQYGTSLFSSIREICGRMSSWGLEEVLPQNWEGAPPLSQLFNDYRSVLDEYIAALRTMKRNSSSFNIIEPTEKHIKFVDYFIEHNNQGKKISKSDLRNFRNAADHWYDNGPGPIREKTINPPFKTKIVELLSNINLYENEDEFTCEIVKYHLTELLKIIPKEIFKKRIDRGAINFDDMLFLSRKILTESDNIRRDENERWKLIIIDEFQDTNRLQADLLGYIFQDPNMPPIKFTDLDLKAHPQTFRALGDPKQSIYAFRGSEPSIMLDLFRKLNAGKKEQDQEFTLDDNYRTGRQLIDFLNKFFSYYLEKFDYKAQNPKRKNQDIKYIDHPPVLVLSGNEEIPSKRVLEAKPYEAAALVNTINDIKNWEDKKGEGDTKPKKPSLGDIAILLRRKKYAYFYENYLRTVGIPCHTLEGVEISSEPAPAGLLAAYLFLEGLEPDLNLAVLLLSPIGPVSEDTLDILSVAFPPEKRYRSLSYYFTEDRAPFPKRVSEVDRKTLREVRELLLALKYHVGYRGPGEIMEYIVEERRLLPLIYYGDFGSIEYVNNLQNFLGIVKSLPVSDKNSPLSAADLVTNLRSEGHSTGEDDSDAAGGVAEFSGYNESAVKIMTVHKAKGLEFPIVIIPEADYKPNKRSSSFPIDSMGKLSVGFTPTGANYKIQPNDYLKTTDAKNIEETEEYRRIFYVGATRAEEHLILIGTKGRAQKSTPTDPNYISWLYEVAKYEEKGLVEVSLYGKEVETEYQKLVEKYQAESLERAKRRSANGKGMLEDSDYPSLPMLSPIPVSNALSSSVVSYSINFIKEKYLKEFGQVISVHYDWESSASEKEIEQGSDYHSYGDERYRKNIPLDESIPQEKAYPGIDPKNARFIGILFHLAMEKTDFSLDYEGYLALLNDFKSRVEYSPTDEELEFLAKKAMEFQESKFGVELKEALKRGQVWREWDFWLRIDEDELGYGPVTLTGMIDLFYINEAGEGKIIDYKLSEPKDTWKIDIYRKQVEIYAKAIEEAGVCVNPEKILWYVKA